MATSEMRTDERMAEVTRNFYRRAEEIRRDGFLSERGRADGLEQLWGATTEILDRLEAEGKQRDDLRLRSLTRALFGAATSSTALAHRDAADRAGQLKRPEEAAAGLARASNADDLILERAIFSHVVQRSQERHGAALWQELARSYGAQNDLAGELEEYLALTGSASRTQRLHRHLAVRPTLPRELQGRRRAASR